MDAEALKREAARAALAEVRPGMKLGLGHGSTVRAFVEVLAEAVRGGLDVTCVAASEFTFHQAGELGIRVTTLEELPELDLGIDGADEIAPDLALIKGGGGALLREKIVASAARRFVVIADDSKLVDELGAFPLPVEVVPFGERVTLVALEKLARSLALPAQFVVRRSADGQIFVTDGGHHIVDCHFGRIKDRRSLADGLVAIPGVVEHGLFLGMAQGAWIAGREGPRFVQPS